YKYTVTEIHCIVQTVDQRRCPVLLRKILKYTLSAETRLCIFSNRLWCSFLRNTAICHGYRGQHVAGRNSKEFCCLEVRSDHSRQKCVHRPGKVFIACRPKFMSG